MRQILKRLSASTTPSSWGVNPSFLNGALVGESEHLLQRLIQNSDKEKMTRFPLTNSRGRGDVNMGDQLTNTGHLDRIFPKVEQDDKLMFISSFLPIGVEII